VFSVHEEYYKQCQDSPIGTYITPVPNFLQGYLQYYMQIQEDKGYDDYELPEVADYAYCTRVVIQNEEKYLQIGCSDDNSLSVAVNIYDDNTCETRSTIEGGYDDANIDVSEIQVRAISVHEKHDESRKSIGGFDWFGLVWFGSVRFFSHQLSLF
jgi:hypothetical protein